MKIIHYFLGFPPYRSGGMTKFAFDLMKSQVIDGHEVLAMWPGTIINYSDKPKLKETNKIQGVRSVELINPLPVPLDEGINEFDFFVKPCDINIFLSFFVNENPCVIHIHTLMGLYREFVQAANQLKIRMVMTSHDYFGICPKVTLYRYGGCCDDDNGCRNCIQCNVEALSLRKIQVMQSPLYRWIKDTYVVKKIRKYHRNHFFDDEIILKMPDIDIEKMAQEYRKLRAYYIAIYELIDFIHFNSTVAEKIYNRYFVPNDSKVVSITHQGIKQYEKNKTDTTKKVILFLAPAKPFKGWNILKEACDQLWEEKENFELRVYSPVNNQEPYMYVNASGFEHNDLLKIMREADVLVAPSIWYETFGFTVLEALSYGVPVIVSNHVGAKDIVGNSGIIIETGNVGELKEAIKSINIAVSIIVKDWDQFLDENYDMYKGGK